jgi:hypothetical protein
MFPTVLVVSCFPLIAEPARDETPRLQYVPFDMRRTPLYQRLYNHELPPKIDFPTVEELRKQLGIDPDKEIKQLDEIQQMLKKQGDQQELIDQIEKIKDTWKGMKEKYPNRELLPAPRSVRRED